MSNSPKNWEHDSGYHLNADGKSIEYRNKENDNLLAIVEAIVDEDEEMLKYYTVIFDTSTGKPWEQVEPHEFHYEKEKAQNHLSELMKKHN